jgi:predicted MPP superfamily phosphohydrolase
MNRIFLALFTILFLGIYGAINFYVGLKGWKHIGNNIPFVTRSLYWVIFIIVSISYIVAMLLPPFIPKIISDTFNIVGGYWLVILMYMVLLLPIIDIIRFMNSKFSFLPKSIMDNDRGPFALAIVVLILMFGILGYGTWSGRNPRVEKYDLKTSKNAGKVKALKIAMVSDIHLGNIMDNIRLTKMIDKINELEPDVVLLAGDIIDNKLKPFIDEEMGNNFKRLKSKYGVFACLGNHEYISGRVDEVSKEYEKAGIIVLRDNTILVEDSFYIVGREDFSAERITKTKRKSLSEILIDVDKAKPILLMDHQPKNLEEAEMAGVDVQVSGHTHRGQIAPANLITGRLFELDYGYLQKSNMHVVVSSGFGTWGPPVRIGSRSEIVQINLDFENLK